MHETNHTEKYSSTYENAKNEDEYAKGYKYKEKYKDEVGYDTNSEYDAKYENARLVVKNTPNTNLSFGTNNRFGDAKRFEDTNRFEGGDHYSESANYDGDVYKKEKLYEENISNTSSFNELSGGFGALSNDLSTGSEFKPEYKEGFFPDFKEKEFGSKFKTEFINIDEMSEQPLYVNAHQFNCIRKRKLRRDFLDSITRPKSVNGSGYLHESRHRHAMNRLRAPSGRFLTKEEAKEVRMKEKKT